jgi:hypothetical protein
MHFVSGHTRFLLAANMINDTWYIVIYDSTNDSYFVLDDDAEAMFAKRIPFPLKE